MFNMNGTHKTDAEIARNVPSAIQKMIQDGVMKPENAPKSPIKGFEDANQFLLNYPSDVVQSAAPAAGPGPAVTPESTPAAEPETASIAPPAASADCPKDQPWLCPVAGVPPALRQKGAAANARRSSPPPARPAPPAAAQGNTAPETKTAEGKTAPEPSQEDSAGKIAGEDDKTPFYVYGPNDVLGVTVAGEPTVSGTYTIMPDGRMSMPLIREFKATGMTGPQLTDIITQKLRDDGGILEPVVNVQLLRSNSKHYTVFGAVLRPGPFPLIQETTLLDALSVAGFQEFAKKDKVTVRRGAKTIVTFNFKKAVAKGEGLDKNITLEDGDVIYVPGD